MHSEPFRFQLIFAKGPAILYGFAGPGYKNNIDNWADEIHHICDEMNDRRL
ncbi:MAG: hypothetical protein ACI9KN_000273 [Gammaproteobacteria bacterium]|jgi:hypothetical protein